MADRQHQTRHQHRTRTRHGLRTAAAALLAALLAVGLLPGTTPAQAAVGDPAPTVALLSGAIEQLTLNDPTDVWSGGWVRVSGQDVVLPRNLLLDLPANRMSLQQLFTSAPQACKDRHESGLAASDQCNLGVAGFVTVQANRTSAGDVIAGDVFVEKGREILTGKVTAVNVDEGTFTVGGNAGSAGTLVRLNDPTGRHSVQRGAGCRAGAPNCSPDPRFTLDPDNYTNAFSTGYPFCLPSTTPRTFTDTLDLNSNGDTAEQLTAQALPDGSGDLLCPDGNRNVDNVALDSRRLAPLEVGDPVTVRGNVETVAGTRFLSAYSTKVGIAESTNEGAGQPDYMVLDEMFIDAPAFQRQRIRDQFIGATTEADSDVVLYSVQRDPVDNSPHEFELGTVVGCENVAGPLTCRRVLGPNTFRIRHDTLTLTNAAKNPKLDACLQLRSDPRLGFGTCPDGGTAAEELGILSPLPHEVQARTGRKLADTTGSLKTIDVQGAAATNGQFLFPMGIGLGGIETPNFAEIDINKLSTPTSFDGIPWDLDRRLSPNGCVGGCESTPQPLDPFPFSGFDPRTQGGFVDVPYDAPHYTHSALSRVTNRVLSYVDHRYGKPNGDATVLAWPPVDPPAVGPAPPPPPAGTRGLITGLTPTSGLALSSVVVDGIGFTGATAVSFAGRAADFTVLDDGTIQATVPAGATSGVVSVTAPSGVLTSAVRFTVVAAPTVTGFSPTTGLGGTSVVVTGSGFASATAVSIGNVSTAFTVLSDTQLRATVPVDGVSGPVLVDTLGGTATSAGTFTVATPPPAPTVTGFSPSNGSPGTVVTIVGTNLQTTTGVYFGGAASISVTATPTSVTAIVPAGAFDGPVSVIAAGGGATSAANFAVTTPVPPPPPPVVTAVTPSHGVPGTVVTLTGTGFAFATGVTFNGLPAAFQLNAGTLTATVPDGATTGLVVVTTQSAGPGSSSVVFTVDPPAGPTGPTITSFTPSVGAVGTTVVLTGTGLTGVTGVSVNGTPATSFTPLSPTSVQFVVGTGTTTGLVRVTAAAGIATSTTPFTIGAATRPTITSFTPTSGPVGTTITVTGNGFTGATAVTVGSIPVSSFTVVSATTLTAVVSPGTATGVIKVTGPGGSRLSAAKFTVLLPPVITGFSPQTGNSGTTVTVRGSRFTGVTGVTGVTVNGVPVRSFTVLAGNKLTLVVGTGTTTGPVAVTTAGGTAVSAVSFRVTGTPR